VFDIFLIFESFIFFCDLKILCFYIFVDFRGKKIYVGYRLIARSLDYLNEITEFSKLNSA